MEIVTCPIWLLIYTFGKISINSIWRNFIAFLFDVFASSKIFRFASTLNIHPYWIFILNIHWIVEWKQIFCILFKGCWYSYYSAQEEKVQQLPSREFKMNGSSDIIFMETFTSNKCVIYDEFIDFNKKHFQLYRNSMLMIHKLKNGMKMYQFIWAKCFNRCLFPTCERENLRAATKKRRNKFI